MPISDHRKLPEKLEKKVGHLMAERAVKRNELLEQAIHFYQHSPVPEKEGSQYDLWRIGKFLLGHDRLSTFENTPRPPTPQRVISHTPTVVPRPPSAANVKRFLLPQQPEIS